MLKGWNVWMSELNKGERRDNKRHQSIDKKRYKCKMFLYNVREWPTLEKVARRVTRWLDTMKCIENIERWHCGRHLLVRSTARGFSRNPNYTLPPKWNQSRHIKKYICWAASRSRRCWTNEEKSGQLDDERTWSNIPKAIRREKECSISHPKGPSITEHKSKKQLISHNMNVRQLPNCQPRSKGTVFIGVLDRLCKRIQTPNSETQVQKALGRFPWKWNWMQYSRLARLWYLA